MMPSSARGKQLLTSLKDRAGTAGPQLVLQVGSPTIGWLRPVATRRELQNQKDVRCLTDWRNRFVASFLSEFDATYSRTSEWLADIIGPDDRRILFMIDDTHNQTIGYVGIAFIDWNTGYGEADSIVRGVTAAKGTMKLALDTLLTWAQGQLGLRRIGVRVRSDNPALEFYRKLGFVEERRVPLSSRAEPGTLTWYEDEDNASATISLVCHILQK